MLTRFAWIVFAAATAWLLSALPTQRVDAQNRNLKSPTSVDAARLRALAEAVPDDPVVLLAFAAASDVPLLLQDRERLQQLRDTLRQEPGVVAIGEAPIRDAGLYLMPVAIAGDDLLAVAERVVAHARRDAPTSLQVLATGLPVLEGTIARLVASERATIVPLLLAVLFAAAWLCYRRIALAAAVLLPPLAGIAWTSGAIARLGHPLDPIAALLDPVLLTIGVAASVHFIEGFRRALGSGLAPRVAADTAARELRTPALLATGTTMIGLWSLSTTDIPAVFDFGLRSAMGVGLTHFFAFLILPPWLARCATTAAAPPGDPHAAVWLARLHRARVPAFAVGTVASALGLAGLFRLHADNDPLRLLPASEPARVQYEALAQRLGGVETFRLLVPAKCAAGEAARLLPFLAGLRQMAGVLGVAGPVQRGSGGELAVSLLLAPGGSERRLPLFAACERAARVLGFPEAVPVGASVQIARDSHRLMQNLVGSLGISMLLLGIGMAVGLRSWRLGALGLLPNLLPSLWLYGALGWLDRPLTVATAMIGSTMLGLIVDNTLHLLHHYRQLRATTSRALAMQGAWLRCRRAMTLASAVLMLGFLTAATSRLSTTVEFAMLASATIAAAWFGTAVILPQLFVAPADAAGDARAT